MISITYLAVAICYLGCTLGEAQKAQQGESATRENEGKLLTEVGYLQYGDPFYVYSSTNKEFVRPIARNPTETNEIENTEQKNRRPLFIFTTNEAPLTPDQQKLLSSSGPIIEIRKKRDVNLNAEVPESSQIGKLRIKRTYCRKCGGGGGGYGGYGVGYVPVTYAVYPVYTPSYPVYNYGGGGHGCNTCGGGGYGGGLSGSYSYSSSSSKSSSGSWNYGK